MLDTHLPEEKYIIFARESHLQPVGGPCDLVLLSKWLKRWNVKCELQALITQDLRGA